MEAARNIINIIRKRRAHMVRDVEALCDAYITLANVDATPWKTQRGKSWKNDLMIFISSTEDICYTNCSVKKKSKY